MSETSATEELRRLLDERGVEWDDFDGGPTWTDGDGKMYYARQEFTLGGLTDEVTVYHLTPEQAIAATLGGGECDDVGQAAVFKCSECGWYSPVFTFGDGMPQFCPSCGKAVKR